MKLKALYLILLCFISAPLFAQNTGSLDTTFNAQGPTKGKKTFTGTVGGKAIVYDNKNRIVMLACSTNVQVFYLNRINEDGSDAPFYTGSSTLAVTSDTLYNNWSCLAIQPDGKIIIGGTRGISNRKMTLIRLHEDGKVDTTFGKKGQWVCNYAGDQLLNYIAVQKNGNIILAGTNAGKIFITAVTPVGTNYIKFNKSGYYASVNTFSESVGALKLYNDSIYISGTFFDTKSYMYTLIKLDIEGFSDLTFNKTGRTDFQTPYTGSDRAGAGIYVYPNGSILVGGNSYSSFKIVKLSKYGAIDTTFGNFGTANINISVYMPSAYFLDVDKKNNIFIAGSDYMGISIAKFKPNGIEDSTFGIAGKVTLTIPGTSYSSLKGVLSRDQGLYVTSDDYTPYIAKISYKLPMVIVGKDYVLAGSQETYSIQVPSTWDYNYYWTYSGEGAYFLPDNEGKVVFLIFAKNATDGVLKCSSSSTLSVTMNVRINHNPSNASQLAKVNCSTVVNDCENNFINYFRLGSILNDSSGCAGSGYSDFTTSGIADTLAAGGVYSAFLQINNSGQKAYTGIWVDYNNDGEFEGEDEFVASATTEISIVEINNIILKNKSGYEGPKRLRIRSRIDTSFVSTDGCPKPGERGETEDYLIVLQSQPNLDAPEIITPNNDGFNDYFVIRGIKPGSDNKLSIFDRWGDNKFTIENYENNWGGLDNNGEKLLPGTYYYVFYNDGSTIKGFLEIRY